MKLARLFLDIIQDEQPQVGKRILRAVLYLISLLYILVIKLRVWLYQKKYLNRKQFSIPIISVGNITVGGTGKTPMVRLLAEHFQPHGKKIAILSRGYKKQNEFEVTLVSDYDKLLCDWATAGDEPYLLAKSLPGIPIVVGKKRKITGEYALNNLKSELLIFDDGFSHLPVGRTVDIVLLDATNPFDNGYYLPRGLLREPISNLSRADAIILTKIKSGMDYLQLINKIHQVSPSVPIFLAQTVATKIINISSKEQFPISQLNLEPIIAVAGIANPESFKQTVTELGAKVKEFIAYPDHYLYSENDIQSLIDIANRTQSKYIVTTRKDAVKLESCIAKLGNRGDKFVALDITIEIEKAHDFFAFIETRIYRQ